MNENHLAASRVLMTSACLVLVFATPGCKREPAKANASSRAAVADGAVPSGAGVAGDGGGTSRAVFTVDAADLPGAPAAPLRVVFGRRGAGVAWVVERADGLHVVHNGRAQRAVTAVDQISVSPDGNRIAYSAQVDGVWRMVVDGELGVLSSSVEDPVFSPDSRHVAYVASIDDKRRVVIDGSEGPRRHGTTGAPVFSADSTLLAFAEVPSEGELPRLAVSDLAFADVTVRALGVKQFTANDAGTAIAAVVEEGNQERLVVLGFSRRGAGTKGPPYDAISSLTFGPDGATVAYVAEKEGRRFVVLGGKEAPLPEGSVSGAPVIRPDGSGVGVILASTDGHFLHEAFAGAEAGSGRRYDEAGELAYAPDARSNAFCARRGDSWFIVANGKEGPAFDRVVSPAFSPDGKLLVYRARKDGRRFAVVADADGRTIRRLPAYEQLFPVIFGAGGKSIAYGVKDGRLLAWRLEPL